MIVDRFSLSSSWSQFASVRDFHIKYPDSSCFRYVEGTGEGDSRISWVSWAGEEVRGTEGAGLSGNDKGRIAGHNTTIMKDIAV